MSIHAQEIDLDELNEFDTLAPNDSASQVEITDIPYPDSLDDGNLAQTSDIDEIFPSESFSTHASPAASATDGAIPRKPTISLFANNDTNTIPVTSKAALPSPPPSVRVSRTNDDVPSRFSDVEKTPPLHAAGFVGDEIPTVDPLDSDGEWGPVPTLADLPTKFALNQLTGDVAGEDVDCGLGIVEERKKKKKRKKKSKGVWPPPLVAI